MASGFPIFQLFTGLLACVVGSIDQLIKERHQKASLEERQRWFNQAKEDEAWIRKHALDVCLIIEPVLGKETKVWITEMLADVEKLLSKASIFADERFDVFESLESSEPEIRRLSLRLEERWRFLQNAPDVMAKTTANGNKLTQELFIPNQLQLAILKALDGKALKKQPLADIVCHGEGTRLYRKGGIKELRQHDLVDHKHGVGYFRPLAPPKNAAN